MSNVDHACEQYGTDAPAAPRYKDACFELSARIQCEAGVGGTTNKFAQVKKNLEMEKRLKFCSEAVSSN